MAAKFDNMSPYSGMGNNPVSYIDPDGQEINARVDIDNSGNFMEMRYGQVEGKWGLINVDGKLYDGSAFGNEVV